MHYTRAKTVFEQLSSASKNRRSDQHAYLHRLEVIGPSVLFCQYKLQGAGKQVDTSSLVRALGADSELQDKLQAVLHAERQAQAQTADSIDYGGVTVPIDDHAVRMAIVAVRQQELEVDRARDDVIKGINVSEEGGGGGGGEGHGERSVLKGAYETLWGLFLDAEQAVREAQRRDNASPNLRLVSVFLTDLSADRQVEQALESSKELSAELVHIYEKLVDVTNAQCDAIDQIHQEDNGEAKRGKRENSVVNIPSSCLVSSVSSACSSTMFPCCSNGPYGIGDEWQRKECRIDGLVEEGTRESGRGTCASSSG